MNLNKNNISKAGQTSVLVVLALFLTGIIAWANYATPPSLALGSLYTVVILYSWLFPQRFSSVWAAIICSILIIVIPSESKEISEVISIAEINHLLSIISIWICASLVAVAKQSFKELEKNIYSMEDKIQEQTSELQELNETLEQQVYMRTEELKSKNKELAEFAYVASHDLQEPLNTVNNFIELLVEDYNAQFDEQGKEYLKYISESSVRLRSLIQDLLTHSRIGREKSFSMVNTNELIENILTDLKEPIERSGANFSYQNLPSLYGAITDFRLLFQNLISNAIKFKKPNEDLEVEIRAELKQNHYHFIVSDNGIGILQDKQEKIFTIFRRLHNQDKFQGNGIGLAHCRKIVEFYGGNIWVESEVGIGSRFNFIIPD
ncbi:MAG: ATP-binding protein [Vicingaceae bacterium]